MVLCVRFSYGNIIDALRSQLLQTSADGSIGLFICTSAQAEHYIGFLPYVPGLLETATKAGTYKLRSYICSTVSSVVQLFTGTHQSMALLVK
jgi:hypothetical protein